MTWVNPTRAEVLAVARSTGETVVEAWSGYDKGAMGTVFGPMCHHTGSKWVYPSLKAPTLRTVREGRSDLLNSLCMYYIDYDGVIYCINNRLSWHAGTGNWKGITDGNGHFAGIEAESDGVRWTDATIESYEKLAAAILRKTGYDASYAPRHAQYALPQGRKSDFSGYDITAFYNRVAGYLAGDDMANSDEILTVVKNIEFHVLGASVKERGYDMLQSIESILVRVEQRMIVDPGKGPDRMRDMWGELQAIRGDLAALREELKK